MTTEFTETLDATLVHYGIPGMRWGKRMRRGPSVVVPTGPEAVTVKTRFGGNHKLETSGGRGHNPSEDAVTAASLRQKAHASGTHSLSNHELSTLVTRMNLESNYQKAITAGKVAKKPNLLEKFIEGEKNTLISGKKPKTAKLVEAIIAASAGAKYAAKHKK